MVQCVIGTFDGTEVNPEVVRYLVHSMVRGAFEVNTGMGQCGIHAMA